MDNLEDIRYKLLEAINPNSLYTMEDFQSEYQNVNHTAESFSNYKMEVKILNKSNNPDPGYATDGAAGFDFRANIPEGEEMVIKPGQFRMVPTGLHFELPENLELQVRPRSGLAAKHGVTVLNSPGTVDSDYRGEVLVILINHGSTPFVIKNGERIAQGVLSGVITKTYVNFKNVDVLGSTDRGEGGFGSTGLN